MQILWKKFKKINFEAQIDECGIETGTPGVGYSYTVTKPAVIHIIEHGTGTFQYNQQTYTLKSGDLFLLREGMEVSYTASNEDPWTYYWVGFSGNQALSYLNRSSLIDDPVKFDQATQSISREIIEICEIAKRMNIKQSDDILMNKHLFELLYELQKSYPKPFSYYENEIDSSMQGVLQYINTNFNDQDISVQEIAKSANISRSYLYKIFHKHFKTAPTEYLRRLRMYKASHELIHSNETISIIAMNVGYKDPLVFTRAFKKHFDLTPSQYRSYYQSNQNKQPHQDLS